MGMERAALWGLSAMKDMISILVSNAIVLKQSCILLPDILMVPH